MTERIWRFCRAKLSSLDPILTACALVLSLLGILTIVGGLETFGWRTVTVQIGATLVGFVVMVTLANVDYRLLSEKLWPIFYAISVLLLLLLAGDCEEDRSTALLTLALYVLM